MGKKRKRDDGVRPAQTSSATESNTGPVNAPAVPGWLSALARHPMLWLAWGTLCITLFAIGAAFRYRNHMEVGAIREPTGAILWAAISVTAFASHHRQMKRERSQNDPPK